MFNTTQNFWSIFRKNLKQGDRFTSSSWCSHRQTHSRLPPNCRRQVQTFKVPKQLVGSCAMGTETSFSRHRHTQRW